MAAEARPPFSVFPTIELRAGRCTGGEDPIRVAEALATAGAQWIHVVDADEGSGGEANQQQILRIAREVPVRVQAAGGIRGTGDLEELLDAGVSRAVLGAPALEDAELVRRSVDRWGHGRIAAALTARGRQPQGWSSAEEDVFDVARGLAQLGVRTLIYADVDRDGMQRGPNMVMASALAGFSGAEVIVSGGIEVLEDVEEVHRERRMGVRIAGVIVGQAYYEGRIDLAEAIRRVEG